MTYSKGKYKMRLPDNLEDCFAVQRILFDDHDCEWISSGKALYNPGPTRDLIIREGVMSIGIHPSHYTTIHWKDILNVKQDHYDIF